MTSKIVFTDTAKSDLRELAVYLAEISKDRDLAIRFVKRLQEKTKVLEDFPQSGAVPRDRVLKSNGYRYLVHDDYLIFYHVDEEKNVVYILSVFNSKRDYMRVMRKFI